MAVVRAVEKLARAHQGWLYLARRCAGAFIAGEPGSNNPATRRFSDACYGKRAAQLHILGQKHLAHAACADSLQDFVVGEGLVDHARTVYVLLQGISQQWPTA